MVARPVRFTAHAVQMLTERGLDRDWVLRTLRAPDVVEADPLRPGRWRALARLPERDGRWLRVVYEDETDGTVVVTAFLDRGRPA